MVTQTKTAVSSLVPYRITVRQFRKMIDANVFPEGDHVELLGGVLVAMTKNDAHEYIVRRLGRMISPLLPPDWIDSEEKSIQIGRFWRPEPDYAILRGTDKSYAHRTPGAADVGLLVEVADSSYPKDAGIKLRRYAAARIPVYWIVHVGKRQVEVYSDPQGRGRTALYRGIVIRKEGEQVPVVIDGQERGRLAVGDLLP
jgi:Uma2 family endonuclease